MVAFLISYSFPHKIRAFSPSKCWIFRINKLAKRRLDTLIFRSCTVISLSHLFNLQERLNSTWLKDILLLCRSPICDQDRDISFFTCLATGKGLARYRELRGFRSDAVEYFIVLNGLLIMRPETGGRCTDARF